MDSKSHDVALYASGKDDGIGLGCNYVFNGFAPYVAFIFNKLLAYLVISNAVRNLRYCMNMIKAVFLLSTLSLLAAESQMFEMTM